MEDGSIRANPCNIKGAGEHEADERPVATLAQVFALAEAIHPRYRLVVLATFTSLRYGEIMGLRRGHFALADRRGKIEFAHVKPDAAQQLPPSGTRHVNGSASRICTCTTCGTPETPSRRKPERRYAS